MPRRARNDRPNDGAEQYGDKKKRHRIDAARAFTFAGHSTMKIVQRGELRLSLAKLDQHSGRAFRMQKRNDIPVRTVSGVLVDKTDSRCL